MCDLYIDWATYSVSECMPNTEHAEVASLLPWEVISCNFKFSKIKKKNTVMSDYKDQP